MSNRWHSPKINKPQDLTLNPAQAAPAKKNSNTSIQQNTVSPNLFSSSNIMQLQRTIGNQAVQRMLSEQMNGNTTNPLQRARVEEEELQMKSDPTAIQRAGAEEEELQMKADPLQRSEGPEVEEEELQMKSAQSAPIQAKSASNKMPEDIQAKMEHTMGADFSNVNIHEGSKASDVGALAYAQGNDIHFAQGQYNPASQDGQKLLGHELTHVVQQREGRVKPTTQFKGQSINDDPALEQEADNMGAKAASSAPQESYDN